MARNHQKRHNTGSYRRRTDRERREARRARAARQAQTPPPRRRVPEAEVRRLQRARRRQASLIGLAVMLVLLIFGLRHSVVAPESTAQDGGSSGGITTASDVKQAAQAVNLSQAVMYYQPVVQNYAEQNDIAAYTDTLLAIMQVESGGKLTDIMQSSSSAELPDNSLEEESSIRQGCAYFASLLRKGKSLGCDLDCIIQAYNYGSGFLDYAAQHGGVYSTELAETFAEEQSGGATLEYTNPMAVAENGGWRYAYGNMFYARLVKQYLVE
ncbi:lysozyme family protein [uncultured Agathobaculum sp.]|uniref:lysozyme family protein n=1 Tax=uncultured Agathobaculum sp. TaxID=2048140 RepID=UPI00296FD656